MQWLEKLHVASNQNVPISTQVADQLQWLILTGVIEPEDRLPPVRDLAKRLGINLHTVRAAYQKLETNGLVETIQGTGSIIKEFDPADHARKLSSISSNTFGVIVPDTNPFYAEFLNGVDVVARAGRLVSVVYNTHNTSNPEYNEELNRIATSMLMAKGIEGLIVGPVNITGGPEWNGGNADYFRRLPFPVVFIDRPEIDDYVVNLDAEHAGDEATEHLIRHGHTKIALITGNTVVPTLNRCYSGYLRTLEDHNLDVDHGLIEQVPRFSYELGYQACTELLDRRSKGMEFSAIFIAGDVLAVGALRAIEDHGMSVPSDLAVISYNDIDLCKYTTPPLTTVAAPVREMGILSAEMLIKRMHGEEIHERNILLPTNLIVRRSCGCAAQKIVRSEI